MATLTTSYQLLKTTSVLTDSYGTLSVQIYAKYNSINYSAQTASVSYQARTKYTSTYIDDASGSLSVSGTGASSNSTSATHITGDDPITVTTSGTISYSNGSASGTATATLKMPNWSDSGTASASFTLPSIPKYTVTYNANGGSGAPSSQTKWHGKTLTLSSTKPTRTGYTFKGWGTSASDTSVNYNPGGSYTANAAVTLYAIWQEHALTVNYYSSYAASAFDGALNEVGSDKNVLVYTNTFYYDDSYANGLADYSTSGDTVHMTRTGYTATGYWGTTLDMEFYYSRDEEITDAEMIISTDYGTVVHEDKSFSTGQELAEAFGLSLEDESLEINLYPQWDENWLTINYYSNYATSAFDGALNTVGADKNVLVKTSKYYYDDAYSDGLANYSASSDDAYMERTRYDATGYWGTALEMEFYYSKDEEITEAEMIISTDFGTVIHEDKSFSTGQELVEVFGLSLEEGNVEINLYPQWVLLASKVTWYGPDGNAHKGLCHFYDDGGVLHYAIITVYDSDGNARVVI